MSVMSQYQNLISVRFSVGFSVGFFSIELGPRFLAFIGLWNSQTKTQTLTNLRLSISSDHRGRPSMGTCWEERILRPRGSLLQSLSPPPPPRSLYGFLPNKAVRGIYGDALRCITITAEGRATPPNEVVHNCRIGGSKIALLKLNPHEHGFKSSLKYIQYKSIIARTAGPKKISGISDFAL